ncbi:MAG TPA: hypothetical protein VED40_10500 [Azospirillaceae bacterium]|nr:hypothetical protein [Azospirillaceae bacterium]
MEDLTGGRYVRDPGTGARRLIDATAEHPGGNRSRDADGTALNRPPAPVRRRPPKSPVPPSPVPQPTAAKE